MYLLFHETKSEESCPNLSIEIDNCNFTNNILNTSKADSGVAINIYNYQINGIQISSFLHYKVNITSCNFSNNKVLTRKANTQDLIAGGATVYISKQRKETFISDSSFVNNSITAISAFNSIIVFSGNVTITNNKGVGTIAGKEACNSSIQTFSIVFTGLHTILKSLYKPFRQSVS